MATLHANTPAAHGQIHTLESGASAVSWGAIIAGAVGAAAISLFLIVLGGGLGLSSVSAWSDEGASGQALGWSTIIWLTLTQLIAAGLGGYLAGRLRTRWSAVHADEVYFRDTAHGFLAWAVSMLLTVVLLAGAVGSVLGMVGSATSSVTSAAAQAVSLAAGSGGSDQSSEDGEPGFIDYYVRSLIRQSDVNVPQSALTSGDPATRAEEAAWLTQEITPIVVDSLRRGEFSEADRNYVAQLVARYTGVSAEQARERIDSAITEIEQRLEQARQQLEQAKQQALEAAEAARKAAAYTALWVAISLLIGAFTAALMATFGGRLRDKS